MTGLPPSGGASFKDVADAVNHVITAAAVVFGGGWAYFKLLRGRTYKPRLVIDLSGQWRKRSGPARDVFHARIRVTNIGIARVSLKQYGTALQVSFPAPDQPEPPSDLEWSYVPILRGNKQPQSFEIFRQHAWIEPGETISDDLLLDLDKAPETLRLEASLTWGQAPRKRRPALTQRLFRLRLYRVLARRWSRGGGFDPHDVRVFARRIIPADAKMIGDGAL
jgi:hypothetical protein